MRKELAKIKEVRATFTGTYIRTGSKASYKYTAPTLLLQNVKDSTGKVVTDHLWCNFTKGFAALGLKYGDLVQFDARVKPYTKGYQGRRDDVYDKPVELDYKLSHPTKLSKVGVSDMRTGVFG